MRPPATLAALLRAVRIALTRRILSLRIQAHNPGLTSDPSAIWDYGYRDVDDIEIGRRVWVGPYSEIVMYRRVPNSTVEGKLVLKDGATISMGCDLRVAGGLVEFGHATGIGSNTVVVAANHATGTAAPFLLSPWDEERTGVILGDNVWVGANCTLLPGTRIGDSVVIAAGSVVRGDVPTGEIWGGVPARRLSGADAEVARAAAALARDLAATGTSH